jgi:hypothetical protein
MNKQLIRDLAITGGIYDCITDPYDKLKNGDPYSSVMIDLERFAEKIVAECIAICKDIDGEEDAMAKCGRQDCAVEIREHFGVEL